jgi:GAF domain-containing protein
MVQPDEGQTADQSPLPLRGSNSPEDEQQVMLRRLWKSDELIKQLKHIVKAQHGKIEELRERLEFEPTGIIRGHLIEHDAMNMAKVRESNEELRQTVFRLKADLQKARGDNDTLRKTNKRLKSMLLQQQSADSSDELVTQVGSTLRSTATMNDTQSSFHSAQEKGHQVDSTCERSFAATAPLPSMRPSPASPPLSRPRTCMGNVGSVQQALPGFSKLWRLSSVVPMFWRNLETPAGVLETLIEISSRLLGDGPSPSILVYMLDPWLRLSASEPAEGPPTLFYLGAGKMTVQVFRKDSTRAEAPRFNDLQALPTRTHATLAVPIQMPTSHTKLAVLQVAASEDMREKRTARSAPKVLPDYVGMPAQDSHSGFTDSQLMYLQLLCNVAGGTLEQLKVVERKQRLLDHMRTCVNVSVAINQARSLPDFEQRVKHELGNFFAVTTVRVLFFEEETQELLISSAQMKRKGVSRLSMDKGVVGLCAKRQAVIHVANISHYPYMDAAADGLQRTGRPISAEASMLVGPLVIEQAAGVRLVGVVQLLERKKRITSNSPDAEPGNDFSTEDQELFKQILPVCANVAWRTFRVQDLEAQAAEGKPAGMAHLLAG